MTKAEAAVTLADLIDEHMHNLKIFDNPGARIDIRDALEAYRNAPPAKAVEVVVRSGGAGFSWLETRLGTDLFATVRPGTRLRITVLDPVDLTDGHPMPGGTY